MNEVQRQWADEANRLHSEIAEQAESMIGKAVEIGRILTEAKGEQAHGDWMPWVEENLSFNARQAQRYMRAYQNRDELNASSATHLTEAMKVLADSRQVKTELTWPEVQRFIPTASDVGVEAYINGVDLFVIPKEEGVFWVSHMLLESEENAYVEGFKKPVYAEGVKIYLERHFTADQVRAAEVMPFEVNPDFETRYPRFLFDSIEHYREAVLGIRRT